MIREASVERSETFPSSSSGAAGLPAVISQPLPPRPPRWRRIALWTFVVVAAAIGGAYWFTHGGVTLPPGIAWSNGRLEANEIDIDTKFAGRVAAVLADEGDVVQAGQVVARMDNRDLEASLRQAEAQIAQSEHSIAASVAERDQAASQTKLAAQELQRARSLVSKGFETQEVLDQRQSQFEMARAAYIAAQARIDSATAARNAAMQSAEVIRVNIADGTLVAPRDGAIQYRLANIGEVLGAGGRVFTMLEMSYVYMDIFLPTAEAGRVALGADARVVLDALPGVSFAAKVAFVASQNQFTPKMVETKSERDRLMFRVRVRIEPEVAKAQAARLRAGLPGVAYVQLDRQESWPSSLRPEATTWLTPP
jgi:HlyD family secretion protein